VLDVSPETASAAAWLVPKLHLSKPVMVTEDALLEQGLFGYSRNLPDRYQITLDWRLDPDAKNMVLIHELAHVVHWEHGGGGGEHGSGWGEAYAEVFRVWVQEK